MTHITIPCETEALINARAAVRHHRSTREQVEAAVAVLAGSRDYGDQIIVREYRRVAAFPAIRPQHEIMQPGLGWRHWVRLAGLVVSAAIIAAMAIIFEGLQP